MIRPARKLDVAPLALALSLPLAAFAVASLPAESAAAPSDVRPSAPGKAKAETDSYVAEAKAVGPYAAGKEGVVEVTLQAKAGYHINAQYPYKLKAAEPAAGVTYPRPQLVRADGTFDEHKATFKLPFVAAAKGKYTVGGKLSLSVCSDANCMQDKVDLDVEVEVK